MHQTRHHGSGEGELKAEGALWFHLFLQEMLQCPLLGEHSCFLIRRTGAMGLM